MICPKCGSKDLIELAESIYSKRKKTILIIRKSQLYECLDCGKQFLSEELKYGK